MPKKKTFREKVQESELYKEFKREGMNLATTIKDDNTIATTTIKDDNTIATMSEEDNTIATMSEEDNTIATMNGEDNTVTIKEDKDNTVTTISEEELKQNDDELLEQNLLQQNDEFPIINKETPLILKLANPPPWFHNFILRIPFMEEDTNSINYFTTEEEEAAFISFYSSEKENSIILEEDSIISENDNTVLLENDNDTVLLEDFNNTLTVETPFNNQVIEEQEVGVGPVEQQQEIEQQEIDKQEAVVESVSQIEDSPSLNNNNNNNNNTNDNTNISVDDDSLAFPSEEESSSSLSQIEVSEFVIENSDSLEFPEIPPIETVDWVHLEPILSYLIDSPSEEESPKKETVKPRKETDQSIFFDPRYLYFLKKVCNLSKKECVIYGKDHNKLLIERGMKNKASVFPYKKTEGKSHTKGISININSSIGEDSRRVDCHSVTSASTSPKLTNTSPPPKLASSTSSPPKLINTTPSYLQQPSHSNNSKQPSHNNNSNEMLIRKVERISDLKIPPYDKVSFEYLVYKYNDNLKKIASESSMCIKDVILIYYLKYHNRTLEMTGSLLDKYVDAEWSLRDRIIFEENFNKYGNKFNKFIINKNEEELRIYYRFYLKNYLPVNWNEEERTLFAHLILIYKKDWNSMAEHFERKNSNDLRVFYSSYFKKLDEEERGRELNLVELKVGEGVELVAAGEREGVPKKRGRKKQI